MKRVVIIQRRLTHYRLPLFERLREQLARQDIQLDLLVGKGTPAEEKKRDGGVLPWAQPLPTHYYAKGRLCWQHPGRHLDSADLVVVSQENKLLLNHLLLFAPRRFKLAFWGHGGNLQSGKANGVKERFKRWSGGKADWWFAYTQLSADRVAVSGYPRNRITVLNNAIDTSELQRDRQSVSMREIRELRRSLDFGDSPAGVYVGSLYADKRLDFLFAAAASIRRAVPDFRLLIVGDGPERDKVRAWCDAHPWTRWAGVRFGREKAAYLSAAQAMLIPGAVGLSILDAFACETPLITTDCGNHGPEIGYLESGVNGVMTADDPNAYVEATVRLLRDARQLDALRAGCAASAREYTVENMARRFADGIAHALAA